MEEECLLCLVLGTISSFKKTTYKLFHKLL